MKNQLNYYTAILLFLLLPSLLPAQVLNDKIAERACACLSRVSTFKQLNDSLRNCLSRSMAEQLAVSSPDEKQTLGTMEGIKTTLAQVRALLPTMCYPVRKIVVEEKSKKFYRMSADSLANTYYNKGNDYMKAGDYERAIKEFQQAVKRDTSFVYAFDGIAACYVKEKNTKKAIKAWELSLDVFPEGSTANLGAADTYLAAGDRNNALKYYKNLYFLYNENADGYFGAGKILFEKGEYSEALDDLCKACSIYAAASSERSKECEAFISSARVKMKEEKMEDLFEEKMKKYNISIPN